jgi:hypothetical protein
MKNQNKLNKQLKWLKIGFVAIWFIPFFSYFGPSILKSFTAPKVSETVSIDSVPVLVEEVKLKTGSIDPENGLIVDENYKLVEQNCSACHSLKLVTQNKADREGWKEIIVWMQETQKLWDLGANEPLILDYLAKNYKPNKKGRRQNLVIEEWYDL